MTDADKIAKLKAHETDLLEQRFKLETRQDEIESALSLLNARLEEVRGALELFDDIDRARAATAKAKAEPEKPPRELAAEIIEERYAARELPENADEISGSVRGQFNPRTLRAALNLAHERRKKSGASEPSIPLEEAPGHSSPATAAPEPEHPERPDFLTRKKESAQ